MDGFDRIYDLHRLLKGRKTAISTQDICQKMECSRATFNRIKKHMVDFLGAPIEYDRQLKGYRYVEDLDGSFELPGLWFSQQELFALLLVRDLLESLGVGLLKQDIAPVERRINAMLANSGIKQPNFAQHFRLLGVATRKVESQIFTTVTDAIIQQHCLLIQYSKLDSGQPSERIISPQRLINYRNNWYLDAWCHRQADYRTFALEGVVKADASEVDFHAVAEATLDEYYQASYGIFAGQSIELATVEFAPQVANRIAREQWHPQQQGTWLDDGSYRLCLPINADQPQEFIMDVVKYFHCAKVIAPNWLQARVVSMLKETLAVYGD